MYPRIRVEGERTGAGPPARRGRSRTGAPLGRRLRRGVRRTMRAGTGRGCARWRPASGPRSRPTARSTSRRSAASRRAPASTRLDVLAINVRTEIMFAASARDAVAGRERSGCRPSAAPSRCWGSAPAAVCSSARPGTGSRTLRHDDRARGPPARRARLRDGRRGRPAREDRLQLRRPRARHQRARSATPTSAQPGVPYHVLLRSILDAEAVADALAVLQRGERSASANFLLAPRGRRRARRRGGARRPLAAVPRRSPTAT